jgi:hypothetical protein
LRPVPIPPIADLTELGLEKLHLANLAPIEDLAHLALQVALLTGDAAQMYDRLERLESWRVTHERRGNHCRRCAGRG